MNTTSARTAFLSNHGFCSHLVHPGAVARRGGEPRATGVPHWWRGLLLAALLGGSGAWVRGCHCCAPDCENDTAPEGTRFQIEVLEELPESDGCHRMVLAPGDRFFLTAGPTADAPSVEGGTCRETKGAQPPEGVETEFEYTRCDPIGRTLGTECTVIYPTLCPAVTAPGYVRFSVLGRDLLDATPSDGQFWVEEFIIDECAAGASCIDKYRIRISRVMEE